MFLPIGDSIITDLGCLQQFSVVSKIEGFIGSSQEKRNENISSMANLNLAQYVANKRERK